MIEKTQPKLGKTRNHYNEESMRYGEVSGENARSPIRGKMALGPPLNWSSFGIMGKEGKLSK